MHSKPTYIELENILKQTQNKLALKENNFERIKSSFYSNISHEIRTPMNAIVGFSQLLSEPGYNSTEIKFFTDEINNNSKKLLHLIENIITMGRFESKKKNISKSFCNLNNIMEDIYSDFSCILKNNNQKRIDLKFVNKSVQKQETLFTDPEILIQILSNMLENIMAFSTHSIVQFGYDVDNNDSVRFFVNDISSRGNNKEITYRTDGSEYNSMNDKYDKNKLRLSVSEKLIQLLGGKLKVKLISPRETSFYFTIPSLY